jgi:hypothetical protein
MNRFCETNKIIIVAFSLILIICCCIASLNPVKAEADNNITVHYRTSRFESLLFKYAMNYGSIWANGGCVYLVMNMTITNNGYNSFNTDPSYFFVVAGNTNYAFDASGTYDRAAMGDSLWRTVDIPNGGTYAGTLVFQIPFNSIVSSFGYSGYYNQSQSFNIVWASDTPSRAPTPAATPIRTLAPTPTDAAPEPTATLDIPRNAPHLDPIYYLIPISAILAIITVTVLLYRRHRKTPDIKQ